MKKQILIVALMAVSLLTTSAFAQTQQRDTTKKDTTKGSATSSATQQAPTGDIVTVIDGSADYSMFATALKAANLETSLKGAGPFTVFAPNNAAFAKLSKTGLDSLMKDTAKLANVLKTHVVSGKYTKTDIIKALQAGKGKATLKAINGETITLSVNDKSNLELTDSKGNVGLVVSFDLLATNGTIHGLNMPLVGK